MDHGGWNHGNNLYDQQLHVPFMIRKPLAEDAGRRIDSLGEPGRSAPTFWRSQESRHLQGSWGATSRRFFEAGGMAGKSRFSPGP